MSALDAEIERLEAIPNRPAGWDYLETGFTFRQGWPNATVGERRNMIIAKGITAHIIKDGEAVEFYVETQKSPPAG